MNITLNIPESVIQGMRVPQPEAEQRLRTELAIALYQQSVLALGPAAELATMTREMFGALLATRGIERHYSEADLERDLTYARRK